MTMKTPFEEVVARHGATVLRVCRGLLGPQDAEDAWSETFLSALRAYPDLDAGANVEAWLVTIARRRALDAGRSRSRRPLPVAEPPEEPATGAAPDDGAHELWAAVGRLPPRQRQAVPYHYLGGLPHREVAALLGGTPEAARRAASDGVASLRRAYQAPAPSRHTGRTP